MIGLGVFCLQQRRRGKDLLGGPAPSRKKVPDVDCPDPGAVAICPRVDAATYSAKSE